jgi:hypothetical protein
MLKLDLDKPITGRVMTISGNVGNGKNTLAVAVLRVLAKRCIHNVRLEYQCECCIKYGINQEQRKLRAMANFEISIPNMDFTYLETPEDFLAIRPSKQHAVCILDEPNAFGLDSRESSRKGSYNLRMARKIQQTRHYNMDIIFLTQLWSMIELRGKRLSSDSVLAVEPEPREFQYGLFKYGEIIPISMKKSYARKNIFPYYDTTQIIGEQDIEENQTEYSVN